MFNLPGPSPPSTIIKMSSTHKALGACKSICAQAHKVSKLEGDISPAEVDKLEEELAEISTMVKSTYFLEGSKYGHLPMVIPQDKVRTLVANPLYIYSAQGDPGAYDPLAANNNTASQRPTQTTGNSPWRKMNSLKNRPRSGRGTEGTNSVRRRKGCTWSPQEKIHRFWRYRPPCHVEVPPHQSSSPNDSARQDNV